MYIDALCVALSFSLTLFLFGPCVVYFPNISEFTFTFLEICPIFIAIAFLFFLSAFALLSIPLRPSGRQKIISVILAISVLMWLQGAVMAWDYGVFDGRQIDWGRHFFKGLLEAAVWISCIVIALMKSASISKIARKASLFLIVVQVISTALIIAVTPEPYFKGYAVDKSSEFTFSSKKNVIILVLDAFQSDVFQEVIEEDGYYKDIFGGFTYFRNALAGFSSTYPSPALILTGHYYDNSMPIQKFIEKAFLSPGSIPKALRERGFQVDLFPDRPCDIYFNERIASNIKPKKKLSGKYYAEKMAAGVINIYNVTLFKYAPHFVKRYVYDNEVWLFKKNPFSTIKEVSIRNHNSEGDLAFIAKMGRVSETVGDRSVFKFFHIWGLHPPFMLNERLELVKLPNDRQGCKIHAKGTLELTRTFLEELKKIGAYDNSLIFIMGDHGLGPRVRVPRAVTEAASSTSLAFPEQGRASVKAQGRALPLMLVKPFGSRGQMKISDAPVCLADVPQTIASQLGFNEDFPGISMFENREPATRDRRYLAYHWEHRYFSRDYLPAMQEYIVSGHSWLDGSWRSTGCQLSRPSGRPRQTGSE